MQVELGGCRQASRRVQRGGRRRLRRRTQVGEAHERHGWLAPPGPGAAEVGGDHAGLRGLRR